MVRPHSTGGRHIADVVRGMLLRKSAAMWQNRAQPDRLAHGELANVTSKMPLRTATERFEHSRHPKRSRRLRDHVMAPINTGCRSRGRQGCF